jgi:hypothetical protein
MQKNTKIFNNENAGIETLLIGLIFSLAFSSIVIAFLIFNFYGVELTGNQAGIPLPDYGVLSPIQDYQNNSINDNVNYVSKFGSNWIYIPNVGRVLSADGLSYMALKGVQQINGVYNVKYRLNNSVLSDYAIIIRYTDGDINQLTVQVKSDGYHIPSVFPLMPDVFYFPYPNANQKDKVQIRTVFDNKNGKLDYYEDGQLIFSKNDISPEIPFISPTHYYAGVGAIKEGFTIEMIDASSIIADAVNIVQQLSSFVDVLARIVLWNVDSQFLPLELNLILIKTQLAGIIICVIMIIRGN